MDKKLYKEQLEKMSDLEKLELVKNLLSNMGYRRIKYEHRRGKYVLRFRTDKEL